jgi:hypothetical protein
MSKKLTYNYVKSFIEKEGYQLLIVTDDKWLNNNDIEKERIEKWLLK